MRFFQTSTSIAYYEQTVELDGVVLIFRFRWNVRFEYWSFDVYDADRNPLMLARRVVLDHQIDRQYHHKGIAPGKILAFDGTKLKTPPGLNELGERVFLLYVEEADLATL